MSDHVNGVRDLVDFFPVYIGIQSFLKDIDESQLSSYQFILRDYDDGALNFTYTSLTLDQPLQYLTDTNTAINTGNSGVNSITSAGTNLANWFLVGLRDSNLGIILVEATHPTGSPLMLEIWKDGVQLAETELPLNITGVEQMFRHKNLIWATTPSQPNGPPDRLADSDVPNEPPTNDKNLVFLHGYNVDPNSARGWFAAMYKRLYWSGSHAKFYGCTYRGNDGQVAGITWSLQTNIVHALETAPHLATFLNSLQGTNVLAAHSLGNMVTLGSMNYTNTSIHKFFMIDAAVAMEAIDAGATQTTNLIHPDWYLYTNRLWATEWHQFFSTNDYRSALTWRNRLSNLGSTDVYNFYSSGEEVLREHVGRPPNILIGVAVEQIIDAIWNGTPFGVYVWSFQEKLKGLSPYDDILSSSHGGWRFNVTYDTNAGFQHTTPAQAALLSNSQLQSVPFFDFGSISGFKNDTNLTTVNGSAYAQTNHDRILSDAIPCLTLPVGANHVARLAPDGGPDRNFDMQATFENGWPVGRAARNFGAVAAGEWHHSDVHEVAYTYIYKLFNEVVADGNLK
jgi:hypothetical protein